MADWPCVRAPYMFLNSSNCARIALALAMPPAARQNTIAALSESPLLDAAGVGKLNAGAAALRPGFRPGLRPRFAFGIPFDFRQRERTLLIKASLALRPALS